LSFSENLHVVLTHKKKENLPQANQGGVKWRMSKAVAKDGHFAFFNQCFTNYTSNMYKLLQPLQYDHSLSSVSVCTAGKYYWEF
jgi:hypothetical protein